MADETKSGLDAVSEGPVVSDDTETPASGIEAGAGTHATVDAVREVFPGAVLRHEIQAGDQHVVFVDAAKGHDVLAWIQQDPAHDYAFLTDVTCVDYGGGAPLQVVYQLFSLTHHLTLRVKCELPLDSLEIASVCDLWQTANWLEREVYDLFGITFTGHPDLRRILMPHDYEEGHPLRKDFPLRGRFSRAEQTLRALNQEPEHFYIPSELQTGLEPQHLTAKETRATPQVGADSGSEG
jgi:NADH-quinone oxidoreductase subunit C